MKPYEDPPSGKFLFISIDLDFWGDGNVDEMFIKKVLDRSESVWFHVEHHYTLQEVNGPRIASQARYLWNIDWHSDLAGWSREGISPTLNCGTWVDHVKWKCAESFLWIHPNGGCARYPCGSGRCDGMRGNAFRRKHPVWPSTLHYSVQKVSRIQVPARILGCSVILSPGYYDDSIAAGRAETSYHHLKKYVLERRKNQNRAV